MSIHQTTDGRWFVAFREKGERKVRRKYFGRGTEGKREAKKWEGEWLTERETNPSAIGRAPGLTFIELAEKYLTQHPIADNTRKSLGSRFDSVAAHQ